MTDRIYKTTLAQREYLAARKAAYPEHVRAQNKEASRVYRKNWLAKQGPIAIAFYHKKRMNTKFSLSLEQYRQIMDLSNCPRCGVLFCDWKDNKTGKADMRTIDQLNPGEGYSIQNCICLCFKCNGEKRNLSAQAHIDLGNWIFARLAERSLVHHDPVSRLEPAQLTLW